MHFLIALKNIKQSNSGDINKYRRNLRQFASVLAPYNILAGNQISKLDEKRCWLPKSNLLPTSLRQSIGFASLFKFFFNYNTVTGISCFFYYYFV